MPSLISVRPKNHSLLLDGEQHPCNEPVLVSHDGSATLTCAVDSKPEATFKWSSSVAAVVGSKTGVTTCVQRADKVFRCTSTLSLPKADIPLVAVKVTCQVDAVGNRTDLCITIGEFSAFLCKFDTHPSPCNANNVEPYIFVINSFFQGNLTSLPPSLRYVTLKWLLFCVCLQF